MLDFIETIEVYELKVNTNSWLKQYINTYEYLRSWSLFDLCPRPLRFVFSIFCCKAARPIEAKSHVELLWVIRMKICSNDSGHVTKMATMPIYGKNLLKIFFSKASRPVTFELGLQQWLGPYKFIQMGFWIDLDLLYSKVSFAPNAFVSKNV